MKKLMTFASLAFLTGSSFAAATMVTDTMATTAPVAAAACAYISGSNTVKLTRSKDVAAGFECTSNGVVTGAAHMQGKKHAYISSTAGGQQTEAAIAANPGSQTDDVLTNAPGWSTAVTNLGT